MRRVVQGCVALAAMATLAHAQTTLTGLGLAIKSQSSATLGTTSFVGTYLLVPAGGATVNFTINASGGVTGAGNPHMQLVIADTTASFSVNSTSATNYTTSNITLPAGTYMVRDERDFTGNLGVSRGFTVNNLSVNTLSGSAASFSNTNDGTTALAAADTYINNFRKGAATVSLTGPGNIPLLAGTAVNVNLARIGFNFGTAVPGTSSTGVNNYLGTNNTTQQTQYQAHLLQNFNAVVPENAGKWANTEGSRDAQNMTGPDTILRYAQNNHLGVRMHNLIWGNSGGTPSWVTTMLNSPNSADAGPPTGSGSFNTNKIGLWGSTDGSGNPNSEIAERIKYYVSDNNSLTGTPRSSQYRDVDVYNETYHTGETQAGSFWPLYTDANGPTGIAQIYKAVKNAGPTVVPYVNEYNVYEDGGDKFANWYQTHIEKLRNAGLVNSLGDVVGGIGTQYYPDNTTPSLANPSAQADNIHNPARMMMTLQNLSTEGLPITLTEFGVKPPNGTGTGAASMSFNATTQQNAANILSDAMRMVFGSANSTGFMTWGFQAEGSGTTFGTNLFQSESALYTVINSGATAWAAGSWTIQPAGKVWQTLLGIQNWGVAGSDGAVLPAWTTQLTGGAAPIVGPDGKIAFSGFYGDYNIGNAIGFSNLSMVKGTTQYSLNLVAPPKWFFWNTANSGTWGNAPNWTNGAAGAAGDTAYFGLAGAARAVTLDAPRTAGMLAFNSSASYTLGGATITLTGLANQAAIYVATGSHQIDAPLVLSQDTTITVNPAAGALAISALQPGSINLTKSGPGTMIVNAVQEHGLTIADGTVKLQQPSTIGSLMLAGTSRLDLSNTSLVLSGSNDPATIAAEIKSGWSSGSWSGVGIVSSDAAAVAADSSNPHKTAIGFAHAGELGLTSFNGQGVAPEDTILRYTFGGDQNLDGVVNALDFNSLATNFGATDASWVDGDFDYDGVIDSTDFTLLAVNFGIALPASPLGSFVPEPTQLCCVGTGIILIRRRRRRCD